VKRILLSLIAICLVGGFAAAQTTGKPVTLSGCSYDGPELCRYFQANNGEVFQLVTEPGVMMPPPNLIIKVTGTVKPKEIGFCTAKNILTASKILPSKQSCRHR
jgi:hypothetical protein